MADLGSHAMMMKRFASSETFMAGEGLRLPWVLLGNLLD
jgi:hypothetical protein